MNSGRRHDEAGNPNSGCVLMTLDNVEPPRHHGSETTKTRRAMGQPVLDNLAAHFAGNPLVTPVV
jgi:D-3-phosphoglycerate dehydrogenase